MKEKKDDRMLSELFRHKLENSEVTPSEAAGRNLMRRLSRREFLHYNPARFNIWYAGAIAVAGAALALILSSGHGKKAGGIPFNQGKETFQLSDNRNNTVIVSETQKENQTVNNSSVIKESGKSVSAVSTRPKAERIHSRNNEISPAGVENRNQGTGIFNKGMPEAGELRGKVYQGENLIKASTAEGCAPLRVKFSNMAAALDSCRWTFGDGGTSSANDPEWLFDIPGIYNISLIVYGPNGMQASSTAVVKVNPRPSARFEISDGNATIPDAEISFTNYSIDAVKYIWDFGDGTKSDQFEPKHAYRKSGSFNIRLTAISETGCSDSVMVINAFSSAGFFINFPNAFIPNPDGPSGGYYTQKSDEASQVFHPVAAGVSEYQLRIFSKRGILIFESNDINIGWDGYYKGQMSEPGVYIWKVRGYFTNGEAFTRMGDITLLRN